MEEETSTRRWWDVYDLGISFFGLIVQVFFREISQRGAHAIPQTGPVLFVIGPHSNQFVDPMVVLKTCHPRRCKFLIAQKSHDRPIVGFFSRALQAIPVPRAQDYTVKGSGTLYQKQGDTTTLYGDAETDFAAALASVHKAYPRCAAENGQALFTVQLIDAGVTMDIKHIVSATEATLTKPVSPETHTLLCRKEEVKRFKVMPYFDQSKVYRRVHQALADGECIGIFPEGGSHDQPELLPLKAGVTLMALGAMAAESEAPMDLKIIPVGLHYYNPHRFRSRAVVEYGSAVTITPDLVEQYKQGGTEKRKACGALLDTITKALRTVTSQTCSRCVSFLCMLTGAKKSIRQTTKRCKSC